MQRRQGRKPLASSEYASWAARLHVSLEASRVLSRRPLRGNIRGIAARQAASGSFKQLLAVCKEL
eukprot:13140292-Alexandrium_andersonii.AAC.1